MQTSGFSDVYLYNLSRELNLRIERLECETEMVFGTSEMQFRCWNDLTIERANRCVLMRNDDEYFKMRSMLHENTLV